LYRTNVVNFSDILPLFQHFSNCVLSVSQ